MTAAETKLVLWKNLYQLVSGTFYGESQDYVKKNLLDAYKELENGLSTFKKPSADSLEKVGKLLKEKKQEKLIPFTKKLYQFIDLDVDQSFEILGYYLSHEYRGSATSLQSFLLSESLMIKLLSDIWFYYSLERMVLLKVTKCVVEFHDSIDHPYHIAFKAVIDKIGFDKLRKSYIDQFETLVKEVQQVKFMSGDIFNTPQKLQSWSERKHREMSEILQIIVMICHFDAIKPEEIEKLVELFRLHSFAKQNQYLSPTNTFHADLVQKVTYNEIALFMIALSSNDQIDWMKKVVDKLDAQINAMHHYPEHGPILLSWMLFKFTVNSENTAEHFASYGKLGSRAVHLNVFDFLLKMMTHNMFKDKSLTAKILARSIYSNLSHLCELFNADGSIAQHPKVFELFSEVLKSPGVAKEFCKADSSDPIKSLLSCAVEKFPHEFTPLSLIAQSLATSGKASLKWIVNFVQELPIYTEQPVDPLYELKKVFDDEDENAYILLNDYQPFRKIPDFVVKAGTRAAAREDKGKMFVHFFVRTNYFDVLHNEINEMMTSIMSYSEIRATHVHRLEEGVKFLAAIIKRIDNPETDVTSEMVHPMEMTFDILNKFKSLQVPSLELMAACLDVCTALVGFYGDDVFGRFVNINIAPTVTSIHHDFRAYANGIGFESGLVGFYLVNIERAAHRFEFLKSYLNFLKSYTKLNRNNIYAIELPGLIFLLREIFVHAHTWHYENEHDKMEVFSFVFDYIHGILTIPEGVVSKDPQRKLLRDVCVYSLLNLEAAVALLKYVAVGSPALLSNFIENETNWFTASDTGLNLLVVNAMRILMQSLRLKGTISEHLEVLTPLEQLIYTQPKQREGFKIIPIVTGYMTYPFNRRFSILSCKLLRRFAIEFQSSLSACLDMEPYQIRMMFLQRLRSNIESDELKVAVLELVNACIEKQPGLTEVFFKVSYDQDKVTKFFIKPTKEAENDCDGILTYMSGYLETIAKDPTKTTNDQLKRIMSLFHALWQENLQSLVKDLVKKENFWPSLCSPLLTAPIANYQYNQLFKILGIELFQIRENNADDENFKKVLEKFLAPPAFKQWLAVVFKLPSMKDVAGADDVHEWLSTLQSFKDFLVLLLRKKSFIQMPNDSNKMLMDQCLQALVALLNNMENGSQLFLVLSELLLILLNDQKMKYTKTTEEDVKMLEQVQAILLTTTKWYNELHKRGKDSMLAIVIKTLDLQSDEFQNKRNASIAMNFVSCNVDILCKEFFNIENKMNVKGDETGKSFSIILSINIMKKLLLLKPSEEIATQWSYWFSYYKIFNRIVSFTSNICQDYDKRLITAEILDLLVLFAKGFHSKEVINCDLGDYLWLKLVPPKELIERSFNGAEKSKNGWTPQDWWIIYDKGIQLVKLLLEKHAHLFIKDALFFVGIHEEYLTDCIMLAKTSLEPNAMRLIKTTLELMSEVIAFESIWRVDYFQCIMSLMKCVQSLLDASVSLLHRPKILKRLTDSSKTQLDEYSDTILTDPSDELMQSMNELIEIVTLCAKCLLQFSPKLLNLLCDVEFPENKWIPFIEVQFGAPKINADSFQQLSFGTVLSAIALFVKALNLQHYAFKHEALNSLPNEENRDGSETVTMSSFSESAQQQALGLQPASPLSPRRPFSKSLSMNSVSSAIVQASNELLSHLDSKICVAAMEFMLTLLASQSLLALKNHRLSSREKQMIRRELSNELYCFHDFVKKKILKDKSVQHRSKLGVFPIVNQVEEVDDQQPGPSRSQRRSHDLRVNVVRKLHLQQKPTFEIPSSFSPIQHLQSKEHVPIDSTPHRSSSNPSSSTTIKRVGFDLSATTSKVALQVQEEEYFVVNPGDPSFTGLSIVKMAEEDYFHLLSHLFLFICQNEN